MERNFEQFAGQADWQFLSTTVGARTDSRRPELRWADLSEAEAEALSGTLADREATAPDAAAASDLTTRLLDTLDPKDRLIVQMLDLEGRSVRDVLFLLRFASCRSGHFGQLRLKAVEVLFVRLSGECLNLGAFLGRFEKHAPGEPCLAGLLGEGHRHLKPVHWLQMLKDDPLRFHDLDKDALILIVHAIGAVHDEAPEATRPQVERVKSVRKALRPPPMLQVFRVSPRSEHHLARHIQDTRGNDFTIRGCFRGNIFLGHSFSRSFGVPGFLQFSPNRASIIFRTASATLICPHLPHAHFDHVLAT